MLQREVINVNICISCMTIHGSFLDCSSYQKCYQEFNKIILHEVIMKITFLTVMVNNSTNINEANNYLSPLLVS
jgi:hypothetical protein